MGCSLCPAWGRRSVVWSVLWGLVLHGCTQTYSSYIITTLDERKIPACVRVDVRLTAAVLPVLQVGRGFGVMHIYSATGGASLDHCLMVLRQLEIDAPP